jgi:hypothetical protein
MVIIIIIIIIITSHFYNEGGGSRSLRNLAPGSVTKPTRRHNPEDINLRSPRRVNLRYQISLRHTIIRALFTYLS